MERHLLMSQREWERKRVLEQVVEGRVTLRKASELLDLSYRQTVRICNRFKRQGARGLIHQNRGRPSNRRRPERFREQVVERYEERYEAFGLGPTLAAEKLAEEGLVVDHETLRRWLIQAGRWRKRRRRRAHRSRRERRHHFGELVQMDGSLHGWFGEDGPRTCLMEMVDDAQGTVVALMGPEETTDLAMRTLWQWIERYGIPQALYTDRKTVFVTEREPTLEEQLAGEAPLTAFGKACQKLGIEIIKAHSPQAKGRVERKHGLLQERLVAELALDGITTIEDANRLLQDGFVTALNRKFAQPPLEPEDFHRPVPRGLDLANVFCFEETRTLAQDWTIRYENRAYQITRDNRPLPRPKDKILVRRHLDGTLSLWYRDKPLAFQLLAPDHAMPRHMTIPLPKAAAQSVPVKNKPAKTWRPNYGRMLAHGGKPDE